MDSVEGHVCLVKQRVAQGSEVAISFQQVEAILVWERTTAVIEIAVHLDSPQNQVEGDHDGMQMEIVVHSKATD